MKYVKVGIAVFLLLALGASLLCGCSEEGNTAGELSDYDSEAFIPVGTPGDNISGNEAVSGGNPSSGQSNGGDAGSVSGEGTQNGGFVVRDKKYDYEGNNLVVLNVENQTDKNYSVTITGTYLNKNGEILKEETKTFTGFAAGWQNNFFFVPEIAFDRFTYTLQTEKYDEVCYAQKPKYSWKLTEFARGITSEDWARMEKELEEYTSRVENGESDVSEPQEYYTPCIVFHLGMEYEFPEEIVIVMDVVILDSQGEVLYVKPKMYNHVKLTPQAGTNWKQRDLYYFPDPDNWEWPEELKGDLTVLFGTVDAFLWDPSMMKYPN